MQPVTDVRITEDVADLMAAVVVQVVVAIAWTPASAGYLQWWHLLTR